jgi:hypothetical protein
VLLTVPSPNQEISSTHLEIRPGAGADHGSAVVTDLGSTNGTVLVQPGLPPEDLQPGIAVQLIPWRDPGPGRRRHHPDHQGVNGASPMTAVTPDETTAFPAAGLERRFYAFAIDRVIAWTLFAAAGVGAWALFFRHGEVLPGVLLIVGVVLLVSLIFAVLLGAAGRSPGQGRDGSAAGAPRDGYAPRAWVRHSCARSFSGLPPSPPWGWDSRPWLGRP